MAIDNTKLANLALAEVGEEPLTSLTDAGKAAIAVNIALEESRDETFALPVNWKFASTRVQLSHLTTSPVFGYTYQFELPPAYVRLISFVNEGGDDIEYPYKRETYYDSTNKKWIPVILADQTPCRMRYLALLESPALWPGWFRKMVYLETASKICKPLTRDVRMAVHIGNKFEKAYDRARAANGMEDVEVDDYGHNLDRGNTDVLDAAGNATVSDYEGFSELENT